MITSTCTCAECTAIRDHGGEPLHVLMPRIAVPVDVDAVVHPLSDGTDAAARLRWMGNRIAELESDLHAARNELTRARLVIDLMAQRLGVPSAPGREPNYEWLLEAVEDLRERCGEVEKP